MSACIYLRKEGHIYPTAPLPIDIKRIFTFGSPRNRSMDSFRSCRESRPSNRVNLIFSESSASPIKSNILVQQEKTTLKAMVNFRLSYRSGVNILPLLRLAIAIWLRAEVSHQGVNFCRLSNICCTLQKPAICLLYRIRGAVCLPTDWAKFESIVMRHSER